MKVTIRQGVFETNSSSMHAFCIVSKKELEKFKNFKLNLNVRWEEGKLTSEYTNDLNNRPDYIWTWDDFVNSDYGGLGYDMCDDIEEFGDKFPPGSVEDLGDGTYKLHYQN